MHWQSWMLLASMIVQAVAGLGRITTILFYYKSMIFLQGYIFSFPIHKNYILIKLNISPNSPFIVRATNKFDGYKAMVDNFICKGNSSSSVEFLGRSIERAIANCNNKKEKCLAVYQHNCTGEMYWSCIEGVKKHGNMDFTDVGGCLYEKGTRFYYT